MSVEVEMVKDINVECKFLQHEEESPLNYLEDAVSAASIFAGALILLIETRSGKYDLVFTLLAVTSILYGVLMRNFPSKE